MMISADMLSALVWPALIIVSLSPVLLIGLLLKDIKDKTLW